MKRSIIAFLLGVIVTIGTYVAVGAILAPPQSGGTRVLARWIQPSIVQYDSGTYTAMVQEIERGTRYIIYVGHDKDVPTYGHMMNFTFYPGTEPIDQFVQSTSLVWSDAGLRMTFKSGHELFIPKQMFTGGR